MTWNVFYSYAHGDTEHRDDRAELLAPLRRAPANLIEELHDREIVPGTDWNTEISNRLDDTDRFLVLLSPAFLASEYCQGVELERAFERVNKGSSRLVPILIRCASGKSRHSARCRSFRLATTRSRPLLRPMRPTNQ